MAFSWNKIIALGVFVGTEEHIEITLKAEAGESFSKGGKFSQTRINTSNEWHKWKKNVKLYIQSRKVLLTFDI